MIFLKPSLEKHLKYSVTHVSSPPRLVVLRDLQNEMKYAGENHPQYQTPGKALTVLDNTDHGVQGSFSFKFYFKQVASPKRPSIYENSLPTHAHQYMHTHINKHAGVCVQTHTLLLNNR